MRDLRDWARAVPLTSDRLVLDPLRVEHADEMAPLLADDGLHTYTGGRPATRDELADRYRHQVAGGPADGSQRWLNWVVRRRADRAAVGTVQATVAPDADGLAAEVAWVVGSEHQGRGYAREAALTMVRWLREAGATRVVAHVHPEHAASAGVARAIGLHPTATVVDGEVRWEAVAPTTAPRDVDHRTTGPLRPPTPDDAEPIAAWHPMPSAEVVAWWAVPDVEPWAMVSPSGDLVAYGELWVDADEDEVELARLIVAPPLRGQGLGKRLVRALIDKAAPKGMATTMLRVQPDNDIAIRCYLACGFRHLGPEETAEWNVGQRQVWTWMRLEAG